MTGMCPLCRANVSSFLPDVSSSWPEVSTFRANVSSGEGERAEGRVVRRMWWKSRSTPSAGSGRARRHARGGLFGGGLPAERRWDHARVSTALGDSHTLTVGQEGHG